jgi:hypothetical protein
LPVTLIVASGIALQDAIFGSKTKGDDELERISNLLDDLTEGG